MIFSEINIDRKRIYLHVLFWCMWVISFTVIQSIGNGINQFFVWLMYYLITLPVFVAHTYILAYWLIPKTFFKKKYLLSFAGILLLLLLFSVIELIVSNELVFRLFDKSKIQEPGYLNFENIIISGIGNHYIILLFLAIKVGLAWYGAQTEKDELLQLKTETEMEMYHYQLQPRLVLTLMEELETIAKTEVEKMPGMIIKLSDFLNGFLFDSKENFIQLERDIKLLRAFLEIHQHALGSRLVSNFIVNGKLQSFVVPPLLLLPFINCAIKSAYRCNNLFEGTVIIKAEKKYLLATFTFWSEQSFRFVDDMDTNITRKRLKFNYAGKHRLLENIDENFVEIRLEIYN